MTTVTFDTHQLIRELREADFTEKQAEAVVRIIARAQESLVTREYLDYKLEKELAPIRAELMLIKWMLGILLAGVMSLILKAFF